MLSIILLIFIGRIFYNLCQEYKKTKWFVVLGVASYFLGEFTAGIILGVLDGFFTMGINWTDTILLTFLGLLSGVIGCLIVYYILQNNWKKEALNQRKNLDSSIDDIGSDSKTDR